VQTIAFLAWLNYQNGGTLPSGGSDPDNAICIDDNSPKKETIIIDDTLDSDHGNDDTFMLDNTNWNDSTYVTRRPHLIVVPASVLSNWMNEFKKFAPHMVVVKYHGNQNEREEIKEEMRKYLTKDSGAHLDVVLTTFSYFSSEKGEDR
jgi:SNF2 family DNA or RNA helicase